MSQHQTRPERDVYDHQDEQLGPSGRRRGPVADWGVGEELFDQRPRRRFHRGAEPGHPARERRSADRPAGPDVPRGGADDGRRTIRIGSDEDVPSEIAAVTADRDIDDAPRAGEPTGLGAAEAVALDREPVAFDREPAAAPPAGDAPPPDDAPVRRTVKIDGRPEGALRGARFHEGPRRGRHTRSASERVGARPERLAAWAFALGLLLILIAVLSSVL